MAHFNTNATGSEDTTCRRAKQSVGTVTTASYLRRRWYFTVSWFVLGVKRYSSTDRKHSGGCVGLAQVTITTKETKVYYLRPKGEIKHVVLEMEAIVISATEKSRGEVD